MMKRYFGLAVTFLAIVATAALAAGQMPNKMPEKMPEKMAGQMSSRMSKPMSDMMNHDDDKATIAVLDHIWLDAAHNSDGGTLGWLFAKDFVEIHPGGEIVDGPKQIEQIMDATRKVKEIHPDNIDVLYITPDAAVVLDTTTIRGTSGGTTYDGKFKVIRIFVKEQGRWKAAGAGIAPIMP
jgi:ketosteroid isomerase-like protein